MLTTLAAAMLLTLGGAPQRQTDTTIAVPAGASLSVNNFGGGITVHGWTENRVKVHGETGRRGRVEVSMVGNTVVVKTGSREGAPSVIDLDISVPQSMGLTLNGTYADITAATANGDIDASFPLPMTGSTGKHRKTFKIGSGSARMELESFQGDIEMRRPQEMRDRIDRKHKEHGEHENENDNDTSFSFHVDVNDAATYAARYAQAYAPKYAKTYA